jgi:hypothetical protein
VPTISAPVRSSFTEPTVVEMAVYVARRVRGREPVTELSRGQVPGIERRVQPYHSGLAVSVGDVAWLAHWCS